MCVVLKAQHHKKQDDGHIGFTIANICLFTKEKTKKNTFYFESDQTKTWQINNCLPHKGDLQHTVYSQSS